MIESLSLESVPLARTVKFDIYTTPTLITDSSATMLLCNDGQDLVTMNFGEIVKALYENGKLKPIIIVGIHCGDDRMNEYGMASGPDFKGRGYKGSNYEQFVLSELIPWLHKHFSVKRFREYAYAGFSMGGLSALDIAWNHPELFTIVGVFSASLWWRSKSQHAPDYSPLKDHMMYRQINNGVFRPGMKFFFQCGELDETADRDKNGVIDAIDDTIDVMKILQKKGYKEGQDIKYLQLPDGRHDVPTWSRALPVFLNWAWGETQTIQHQLNLENR